MSLTQVKPKVATAKPEMLQIQLKGLKQEINKFFDKIIYFIEKNLFGKYVYF